MVAHLSMILFVNGALWNDHASAECCQQWLQTCNKSVALLKQYVCGGGVDRWLTSGLWPWNVSTSNCMIIFFSLSSKA